VDPNVGLDVIAKPFPGIDPRLFSRQPVTVLTHSLDALRLLTPWCRTLFEKLIVTQLIKNILLSLWDLKVHHLVHKNQPLDPILNQMNPVRPIDYYLPKSSLILSSHLLLGLSSGSYLRASQPNPVNISSLPRVCHKSRPPHPPRFNHPKNVR
jgi:hypothetical protein